MWQRPCYDCWEEFPERWDGGVHRYPDDTYYGGGEWVLLTAWLGWYYTQIGAYEKALAAKKWVEDQSEVKFYTSTSLSTGLEAQPIVINQFASSKR